MVVISPAAKNSSLADGPKKAFEFRIDRCMMTARKGILSTESLIGSRWRSAESHFGCRRHPTHLIFLLEKRGVMAKAYWITCYREISDPAKLAAYAKLAVPSIEAGGGRVLARGIAAKAYEAGLLERTVLIEFDSIEQAIAVHDSAGYQAALAALKGGAVRDLRIVAGA